MSVFVVIIKGRKIYIVDGELRGLWIDLRIGS